MADDIRAPRLDPAPATGAAATARPGDSRARETAESFEAMFIAQMLEHMRAGLGSDSNFGGGSAEGLQRSLLDQEYAKQIVKRGGIGVSEAIYREILRMQEVK